jgi:phospholipase B1
MEDQANNLIQVIQSDSRYDWNNDWKVVTLFVGGNDLCASCRNPDYYSPEAYRDGIQKALDVMHQSMPRTLVQVVTMFDVTPLTELSTGAACDLMQGGFCNCVTNPSDRPNMRPTQLGYHNLVRDLINSGNYDTRNDFTVVFQPHMRDIVPPVDGNGDYYKDFLSYDCFHPSRPAHQLFAMYLWDAMLTPVGDKTYWTEIDPTNSFVTCPDADKPFIYTNQNSGLYEKQAKPIRAHRRKHAHQKPLN